MKITIDLENFWMDSETDLESGLKEFVKREVLAEINKSIKDKVETQIQMRVKEEVEKGMYQQINMFIADYIKVGKVKSGSHPYPEITLEELIKEKFTQHTGWSSYDEKIKTLAKQFGDQMKTRYDLLFASQLVAKMSDNGLLKKDAAKLLLETK